jgi:hypothetical protein
LRTGIEHFFLQLVLSRVQREGSEGMITPELKSKISSAFEGITLSGGVSLRQAETMDNYGEGCSNLEFARLPLMEITSDW